MNKKLPHIGFISLGCPKALVDSEKMLNALQSEGYRIVNNYNDADLVIINTCGFINPAIDESLDSIGEALQSNGKVIVTGCLGANKSLITSKYPKVLAITGPNSLNETLREVHKYLQPPPKQRIPDPQNRIKLTPKHYSYLKISEGCNHHCSFCIIPKLRGPLVSRPMNEIISEAEHLVENGVKELIIVSQDTAAYGSDLKNGVNILTLTKELAALNIWIRLHYLYPYPLIDNLLPQMAEKKILPYLDVPLQHINARILNEMRRPANRENILQRIQKWRDICPQVTIRSTFIAGFPGETKEEFNELLAFLAEAQLDRVGCFQFSPVKGAKASELPNQISTATKQKRLDQAMTKQAEISIQKLRNKIGTKIEVIVDTINDKHAIGRSEGDSPEIDGIVYINNHTNLQLGDIITAKITDANKYDLYVTPCYNG